MSNSDVIFCERDLAATEACVHGRCHEPQKHLHAAYSDMTVVAPAGKWAGRCLWLPHDRWRIWGVCAFLAALQDALFCMSDSVPMLMSKEACMRHRSICADCLYLWCVGTMCRFWQVRGVSRGNRSSNAGNVSFFASVCDPKHNRPRVLRARVKPEPCSQCPNKFNLFLNRQDNQSTC